MARVIRRLPPSAASPLLGQTSDVADILVWSFILIFLLVGGLLAAGYLRKWMTKDEDPDDDDGAFTLGDLRRLHQNGKLSADEFAKLAGTLGMSARASANFRNCSWLKALSGSSPIPVCARQGRAS